MSQHTLQTRAVLDEVVAERVKQRQKWGNDTDDTRDTHDWVAIIIQELQPMCWSDHAEAARRAAIKVAAVAVAAVEAHDRAIEE